MDPSSDHSLKLLALENQLKAIHQIKIKIHDSFAQQIVFLTNLETSIKSIIDDPSSLNPPLNKCEYTNIEQIQRALNSNRDPHSSEYEGILVQKDNVPSQIVLAASDASINNSGIYHVSIAAAFFANSSPLNIAVPTYESFSSTEIPEISGIILALEQAVNNGITDLHLVVDNQSALRFLKEASSLGLARSDYLQNKVLINEFFSSALNKIDATLPKFSFLSTSHTKSHTNNPHIFYNMNAGADSLANNEGFFFFISFQMIYFLIIVHTD